MATHPIEAETKTVRDLYQEQRSEYRDMTDRHEREMREVVRREFPIGTSVKYKHGQNFIEAVVDSYPPFEWVTNKVIARNKRTGNKKEIEAKDLDHSA